MGRIKALAWQAQSFNTRQDPLTGVWTARTKYRDGFDVNRSIKRNGRTKGGAEQAVRTAIKRLESEFNETAKLLAEEPTFTVAELTAEWLESRRPAPVEIDETKQAGSAPTNGLTQQTFDQYEANLRLHVLPVLGDMPVATLSTPSCERGIHGLYNRATGTGYRTAALSRQVMQQMFDYAIRQGYRSDNPVRAVSRIPKKRKKPEAMRPATIAAVHQAVAARQPEPGVGGPRPNSRLADIVWLLVATGMRVGEALAVRWEDVDLSTKPVTVTVSGTLVERKSFYRQDHPKNSASARTFQLNQEWVVGMLLRRWANAGATPTGAVFPTRNGTFVRPSNFRDDLKTALVAAGITEKITPHTFRRTVATQVADFFGDEEAARQLGHSSPDTTRASYIDRPGLIPDYSAGLVYMAPTVPTSKEQEALHLG